MTEPTCYDEPQTFLLVVCPARHLALRRSKLTKNPADPSLGYPQLASHMIDATPPSRGAQKFPRAASCKISLSSVRSEIARRSRRFSFSRFIRRLTGLQTAIFLVDVEVTGENVERPKPRADIFLALLEKLPGIDAAQVLMTGDTPYDALAAAKAVGVLCGGFSASSLREAGMAIYQDPADLHFNLEQSSFQRSSSDRTET